MRFVAMRDMIDAMARDLKRDIEDPKTEHRSLSLVQKGLLTAKGYIDEHYVEDAVDVLAPVNLQSGNLTAVVSASISIEAVTFGYTKENVEQAVAWLAAWQMATAFDINR